ncbi:hypothetical protein PV381_07965 [Streptomyces scabiei]|uniref:hypothetical protein n=1 Tax=Streptomyces TaxID=1883 RepID=UPI001B334E03|nr:MULTISPECIES: hypothetical protein [Streptomyces]MDX2626498.1 hypothetical protein [Streptomyces scabiei]MDX3028578.1 hypothetical protein [Streptomyces scabiei]MDX3207352.1 hypothetical protein [Streptomyces scabiei]
MPGNTVTVRVLDGCHFVCEGTYYSSGDTLEIPAEHLNAWLHRALVEPVNVEDDDRDAR